MQVAYLSHCSSSSIYIFVHAITRCQKKGKNRTCVLRLFFNEKYVPIQGFFCILYSCLFLREKVNNWRYIFLNPPECLGPRPGQGNARNLDAHQFNARISQLTILRGQNTSFIQERRGGGRLAIAWLIGGGEGGDVLLSMGVGGPFIAFTSAKKKGEKEEEDRV